MTNINCLQNCIYQNDGKCNLEKISSLNITPHNSCAYFSAGSPPSGTLNFGPFLDQKGHTVLIETLNAQKYRSK